MADIPCIAVHAWYIAMYDSCFDNGQVNTREIL